MFSALGLLVSNVRHDYVKSVVETSRKADPSELERYFAEMEEDALQTLRREGFEEEVEIHRFMDLRYLGQSYDLSVSAGRPLDSRSLARATRSFHSAHQRTYGYSVEDEEVEIVNLRVTATGLIPEPKILQESPGSKIPPEGSKTEDMLVSFGTPEEQIECPVYDRSRLRSGNLLEGPAIVEQYDATTVIYPSWTAEVDLMGNLRLTRQAK
jgi:N-methylhydantoinase A